MDGGGGCDDDFHVPLRFGGLQHSLEHENPAVVGIQTGLDLHHGGELFVLLHMGGMSDIHFI